MLLVMVRVSPQPSRSGLQEPFEGISGNDRAGIAVRDKRHSGGSEALGRDGSAALRFCLCVCVDDGSL